MIGANRVDELLVANYSSSGDHGKSIGPIMEGAFSRGDILFSKRRSMKSKSTACTSRRKKKVGSAGELAPVFFSVARLIYRVQHVHHPRPSMLEGGKGRI